MKSSQILIHSTIYIYKHITIPIIIKEIVKYNVYIYKNIIYIRDCQKRKRKGEIHPRLTQCGIIPY